MVSWIFATAAKLMMPIGAVLLLATRRIQNDDLDLLAVIALVMVVVGAVLLYLVLRSPELAERVGRALGRFVRWAAGLFRKEVTTDFGRLVSTFREQSADVIRSGWLVGISASLTGQLLAFLLLLLSLRFVGIGADALHWQVAFGAAAAVAAVSVIPIFNVPGIGEAILIIVFNGAVGPESSDQVAAAVFVFRVLSWLAPIPFGAVIFSRWRQWVREHGQADLLEAFDEPED